MAFFKQPHCKHCGALLDSFAETFGNYCPECGKELDPHIVYY